MSAMIENPLKPLFSRVDLMERTWANGDRIDEEQSICDQLSDVLS